MGENNCLGDIQLTSEWGRERETETDTLSTPSNNQISRRTKRCFFKDHHTLCGTILHIFKLQNENKNHRKPFMTIKLSNVK